MLSFILVVTLVAINLFVAVIIGGLENYDLEALFLKNPRFKPHQFYKTWIKYAGKNCYMPLEKLEQFVIDPENPVYWTKHHLIAKKSMLTKAQSYFKKISDKSVGDNLQTTQETIQEAILHLSETQLANLSFNMGPERGTVLEPANKEEGIALLGEASPNTFSLSNIALFIPPAPPALPTM